ncbi:MAG: hypothetical protein ACP5LP_03930 [Candidatus Micrarchaeia archaeon]
MIKYLAAFLIMFLISSYVNAGTVVLTGSCNSTLVNNSVIFSIYNYGNDSAYNMIISPVIYGAQSINSSAYINILAPNSKAVRGFKLTNFGINGTYVDEFIASYQQGASTFTAIFPCVVYIGKPTVSPIYETVSTSEKNGVSIVNVTLFNAERYSVNGTLSLMLPPSFSYISNKSYDFNIAPYSISNFTFKLKYPNTLSNYTAAAVASFVRNGLHYSSMVTFLIETKPASKSPISILNLIIILIVAIAALLIAFMLNSILRKSNAKKRHSSRKGKKKSK